jgi:hypothetical protein
LGQETYNWISRWHSFTVDFYSSGYFNAWFENYLFEQLWYKFVNDSTVRAKIVSLAIISNLIWFYMMLNREKWELAMGVIVGTIVYLPYILYVNFIL